MAFGFVEETPGADLIAAPRECRIPIRLACRISAGLAEAVRLRLVERDDIEHVRESVTQLAGAQGTLGQILADQIAHDIEGEPWVRAPYCTVWPATSSPQPPWWRTVSGIFTGPERHRFKRKPLSPVFWRAAGASKVLSRIPTSTVVSPQEHPHQTPHHVRRDRLIPKPAPSC